MNISSNLAAAVDYLWPAARPPEGLEAALAALQRSSVDPTSDECARLMQPIVADIIRGDCGLEQVSAWDDMLEVATANGLAVANLVASESSRPSLIECLLAAGHYKAATFIRRRLSPGVYAQGRVEITKDGVFTRKGEERTGPAAFILAGKNTFYGHLKSGKAHGKAMLLSRYGDADAWYEGGKLLRSILRP